jgi:hypothetical protein
VPLADIPRRVAADVAPARGNGYGYRAAPAPLPAPAKFRKIERLLGLSAQHAVAYLGSAWRNSRLPKDQQPGIHRYEILRANI